MDKKTVLITGAAGYLASSLIDLLLSKNYTVKAFDNNFKNTADTLIPYVTNDNFSFIGGDITRKKDLKGIYECVDYCVHMAAIVGAPACRKYETLSTIVNVDGTHHVLDSKPTDVKLVYCNTGSIYKGGIGDCDENSPVDPQSHYAVTKWRAEEIVMCYHNTIAHRYATAMGPSKNNMRVNLLTNDLCYQALTQKTLTIFEADFMRTFISCFDIASSILFTLENFDRMYEKQRVYNVGNNDLNFTKRQLVERIQEKIGCHVSYADTEKDPDQRDYGYNSNAIYSFGWKPQIGLDQTIDQLIKVAPLLSTYEKYK